MKTAIKKFIGGIWGFQIKPSSEEVNGLPVIEVHTEFNDDKKLPEWIAKVRGNTEEERLANAKLMAASPDLLYALEKLMFSHRQIYKSLTEKAKKDFIDYDKFPAVIASIEAIKKATE